MKPCINLSNLGGDTFSPGQANQYLGDTNYPYDFTQQWKTFEFAFQVGVALFYHVPDILRRGPDRPSVNPPYEKNCVAEIPQEKKRFSSLPRKYSGAPRV